MTPWQAQEFAKRKQVLTRYYEMLQADTNLTQAQAARVLKVSGPKLSRLIQAFEIYGTLDALCPKIGTGRPKSKNVTEEPAIFSVPEEVRFLLALARECLATAASQVSKAPAKKLQKQAAVWAKISEEIRGDQFFLWKASKQYGIGGMGDPVNSNANLFMRAALRQRSQTQDQLTQTSNDLSEAKSVEQQASSEPL